MVGTIVVLLLWAASGWAFNRYAKLTANEIRILKSETLRCATAVVKQGNRIDDCESRIAFLENSLTAKATTAKIVAKPHKTTFRQFAQAASNATEEAE